MVSRKIYNFGEKKTEFNPKTGKEAEVWKSPRYEEAKQKAIETLESEAFRNVLTEGDFWILQNTTKSGKVAYSGLIISHNGCLKINDALPINSRFDPTCVSLDKDGFGGSLVYSYCNEKQGIFEVGEVSKSNCSNNYPYAMALKRLMDRVILKNSKLAYSGIYSDSEAEEFSKPEEVTNTVTKKEEAKAEKGTNSSPKQAKTEDPKEEKLPLMLPEGALENPRKALVDYCKRKNLELLKVAKEFKLNNESPKESFIDALIDVMSTYGE